MALRADRVEELQGILAFATIFLQSPNVFVGLGWRPRWIEGPETMASQKPLILLTNDDGIFSEGLQANEEVLAELGEIFVVAPDRERNANSHTITLRSPIYVQPEGERRFSTTGTPSDCVNIAVHRLLPRRPDLLVSGINKGGNLAEDVTYSGTVGAAMEATLLQIPSMAVSLAASKDFLFLPAALASLELARWILKHGLPSATLLNVNVPNILDGSPLKMRWTRLGQKFYGDFLEEGIDEKGLRFFSYGRDTLRYVEEEDTSNLDWMAVREGFISLTPLRLDLTDTQFLQSRKRVGAEGVTAGQAGAGTAPEEDG